MGWRSVPDCNIGIATGQPSGFFVLDVDGADGEASLRKLEEQHSPLPVTIEALTGKGRHCYFRVTKQIKCSVGIIGAGLDVARPPTPAMNATPRPWRAKRPYGLCWHCQPPIGASLQH
jgi:hypothetical protein